MALSFLSARAMYEPMAVSPPSKDRFDDETSANDSEYFCTLYHCWVVSVLSHEAITAAFDASKERHWPLALL
jgi:hypothetical protein